MTSVADAASRVPVDFYHHNPHRGPTLHYSDPASIHRELAALDVPAGARVLEIGTGTGYSSALLAELAGPHGSVISLDISDHLVRWTNLLHHQQGRTTVRCHTTDGLAGFAEQAPFDRIIAWCTPPKLMKAWTDQLAPDGRLVACLPIAPLPSTTLIATITLHGGQPHVEAITPGGYAQSTPSAVDDALTIPGRWVDWSIRHPEPSWIGICWRDHDDRLHTGARTALDQILRPGHTETYPGQPLDWRSWSLHTAALADPHLSISGLRGHHRGIGHTTAASAALLQTDGTIIADSPRSPSLTTLRTWLERWEDAGRPSADQYTPTLTPAAEGPAGWDLRISRHNIATEHPHDRLDGVTIISLNVRLIDSLTQLMRAGGPYITVRTRSDYWLYATLFSSSCPVAVTADGSLVGAVIAMRSQDDPGDLYVQDVLVDPRHRGRGIAQALLRVVVGHARQWNCRRIYLTSEPGNHAAARTWHALGFRNLPGEHLVDGVHVIADFKGPGRDRAVYQLDLDQP